jgi:hypothetical protein
LAKHFLFQRLDFGEFLLDSVDGIDQFIARRIAFIGFEFVTQLALQTCKHQLEPFSPFALAVTLLLGLLRFLIAL